MSQAGSIQATGRVDTFRNNGNVFNLSSHISGTTSGLSLIGSGTLNFTGNNTYVGNTSISTNTIGVEESSVFGNRTVTFASASLLEANNNVIISNTISLSSSGVIFNDNGNTLTLSGVISGSHGFTKQGGGTLILSGTNTYTGNTVISAGTVDVGNGSAFGTGTIMTSPGTSLIAEQNSLTVSNHLTVASGGFTTVNNNGFTFTLSGGVSGAGGLNIQGMGTLILTGSSTYTGGTGITDGNLSVEPGSLGSGGVTINLGGTLVAAQDGVTLPNTITLASGGNTAINDNGFTLTLTGQILGAGSLTKEGSGTLILHNLSTQNAYTGGTVLTAGTIEFEGILPFNTGQITISPGTTLTPLTNGAALSNFFSLPSAGQALINTNGFILFLNGEIAGLGELTKEGAGTLFLTGANIYSGDTVISAGNVTVAGLSPFGTGNVTFDSGTSLTADEDATISNLISLPSAGITFNDGGNTLTFNEAISGMGGLTI